MSVIDLEPLTCLKRTRMDVERGNCEYNVTDYLDTIEAALLELQSIREAKSSEALECLKQIEDVIETKIGLGVVNTYLINIIKQALLKSQEQEKVLKEVKADLTIELNNKKNAIEMFKQERILRQKQAKVLEIIKEKNVDIIMIRMSETLDKYNQMIYKDNFNRKELTQEEFDLLKRYCKKDRSE